MWIKERLLTPGPTALAESTRLAMAAAPGHHRTAAFASTFLEVLEHLRWLWETDDDVLIVTGSGTAGMEAALTSVFGAGDRILVVTGGKFAERWSEVASRAGVTVDVVSVPWGDSATVSDLLQAMSPGVNYAGLVMVSSETSTGKLHPVSALAEAFRAHHPEGLVVVDGITAVGCVDLSMRRHGIDILVSGSQKAFGLPPGMAMVGVSARAWVFMEERSSASTYLDLRKERKQTSTGQSAWTPNTALIHGLHEVMGRWRVAGREALFSHTGHLAAATRLGVRALGLSLFGSGAPSPALTSIALPEDLDGGELARWMRSQGGVQVAGGQDQLKGRILRIGHLGPVDWVETLAGLAALGMALEAAGRVVDPAAGVSAAMAYLAGPLKSETPVYLSP